ncbi:MAG: pyruvate, phosphate dikinase [Bdellovibrio sp.]|nr:pyruvate, phosphate dikinase [Bdellovibrio sp.]
MTHSQITQSPSGTETTWSKNDSRLKTSPTLLKKKLKTGETKKDSVLIKALSGKLVYFFGGKKADGNEAMKALLGGKGANLHGMTKLGLPVPPGFTITTVVCEFYYKTEKTYPKNLEQQVKVALNRVEKLMNRKFGGHKSPLLVSVRSGARASMPGMMDTVLNLGLNDETIQGLIDESKDQRFSYDSYRRFVSMYSDVVLGIHSNHFEAILDTLKQARRVESDTALSVEDLQELVKQYKQLVRTQGKIFPENPWDQLWGAIGAVFGSWMSPRAITYRKIHEIPESWGTAVNIQAMVFGNMGDDCATGVAFTRDPSTGEKKFFGEYLTNAQGEDVVAGIRTPQPINEASKQSSPNDNFTTLEQIMPKAYKELVGVYQKLEKHYRDMQDVEFTIERSKLYMLQTRTGKRTALAALKIATDMITEKLITKDEALLRIQPEQLDQLLHPCLDPKAQKHVLCKGLPASPGAVSGQIVFDPDTAEKWAKDLGRKVILVRIETSPEDIHGMSVAEGILTARGGMTSHAAVVARGMGKCCVSGCGSIKISYDRKEMTVGSQTFNEGDNITLDGSTGEVIEGTVPTIAATMNKYFQELMNWVDLYRTMGVRANADTPLDAKTARRFGAEGIGLCRTEHMFFETDRIDAVREMILAEGIEGRERALAKILPMQKSDFKGIFREMKGLPVTIRLLDPPLHEFIPQKDEELRELAAKIEVSYERLKRKAESLHEFNPMLGHRGCRLGISYPEIYKTQVRAIMEAVCELVLEEGFKITPEIMIPLVGDFRELKFVREYCETEIEKTLNQHSMKVGKKLQIDYLIGTMIELPRAAVTAKEIACYADFFSFGTNDLTQTTYGLSRDDSGMFLKDYIDAKIYEKDPFATLDPFGVGRLMDIAIHDGRQSAPALKIGICGEHGGEPASVEFCHKLGLDYVSCSPFRVPIARLAAAQAAIKTKKEHTKTTKIKRKR